MTFNPGAIPAAVAMLAFAWFVWTGRERILDRYDRKRRRTRSATNRKIMVNLAGLMAGAALGLAAACLFYKFD